MQCDIITTRNAVWKCNVFSHICLSFCLSTEGSHVQTCSLGSPDHNPHTCSNLFTWGHPPSTLVRFTSIGLLVLLHFITYYSCMASMAEIREGFLCPICMKDLGSVADLTDHFEDEHAEEDKAVLKQFKGNKFICLCNYLR